MLGNDMLRNDMLGNVKIKKSTIIISLQMKEITTVDN